MDSDSDSGSDRETFFPEPSMSKTKRRKTVSKDVWKGKRKISRTASKNEDQAATRTPLGQAFVQNRQLQRVRNHTKMSSATRSRTPKTGSKDKDQEPTEVEKENKRLMEKVARMEKERAQDSDDDDDGGPKKKKGAERSAMEALVQRTTNTKLFKRCKFIRGPKKLKKGTKFVMMQLHLKEMDGLDPAEKAAAEKAWIHRYKDVVRKELNKRRNYVQQELREWCEKK